MKFALLASQLQKTASTSAMHNLVRAILRILTIVQDATLFNTLDTIRQYVYADTTLLQLFLTSIEGHNSISRSEVFVLIVFLSFPLSVEFPTYNNEEYNLRERGGDKLVADTICDFILDGRITFSMVNICFQNSTFVHQWHRELFVSTLCLRLSFVCYLNSVTATIHSQGCYLPAASICGHTICSYCFCIPSMYQHSKKRYSTFACCTMLTNPIVVNFSSATVQC
jgi:hypothetical protein